MRYNHENETRRNETTYIDDRMNSFVTFVTSDSFLNP